MPEPLLLAPVAALLPLALTEVSTAGAGADRALLAALLRHHHYLSHRSWVGENLQYLVRDHQGRPVACLLFGAAAWKCAARDRHIGWDAAAHPQRVYLLANNTRFLILPRAPTPHLASHRLAAAVRRLRRDWPARSSAIAWPWMTT